MKAKGEKALVRKTLNKQKYQAIETSKNFFSKKKGERQNLLLFLVWGISAGRKPLVRSASLFFFCFVHAFPFFKKKRVFCHRSSELFSQDEQNEVRGTKKNEFS